MHLPRAPVRYSKRTRKESFKWPCMRESDFTTRGCGFAAVNCYCGFRDFTTCGCGFAAVNCYCGFRDITTGGCGFAAVNCYCGSAESDFTTYGCGFAAGCEARLCLAAQIRLRMGCALGSGFAPAFMGQRLNQGPSPKTLIN
jgi:hypothetical protein